MLSGDARYVGGLFANSFWITYMLILADTPQSGRTGMPESA